MTFVVDAADWKLDGKSPAEARAAIERFLAALGDAKTAGQPVWFGEDFQDQPVLGKEILWDLMVEGSSLPLSREIWEELSAYLGIAECYTSDERQPPNFPAHINISIDGGLPVINKDVAWAHHSLRARRAVACLGLWRNGSFETSSAVGATHVYWVNEETSTTNFWRSAINIEGNSSDVFERLAPRAYPKLYFYNDVLKKTKDFLNGYNDNSLEIKRHLEVLNDEGHWVFTAPPLSKSQADAKEKSKEKPSNQLIEQRFKQLKIDAAPEKPNVYKNNKCRAAREIEIKEKIFYCEWHCKIEKHRNRIHIHEPTAESNDKLIIAIFTRHLPLPGHK